VPGNEDAGFSEALVGVDGEWRGIQVKAMPKEKQVIDFDPTSQVRSSLPGANDDAPDTELQAMQSDRDGRSRNGEEATDTDQESEMTTTEAAGETTGVSDG
jgi:type IV secretory pathway VirB4 component